MPANRVKPCIGVTAAFASTKIAGIEIPVFRGVLIRYPFPACINKFRPNFLLKNGLQDPAAKTNSSAFSVRLSAETETMVPFLKTTSSTFSLVKIKYLDCTNYEGEKLLLYKNCTLNKLVSEVEVECGLDIGKIKRRAIEI